MKLSREKEGLKLVTITLETLAEVKYYAAVLGATSKNAYQHAAGTPDGYESHYTVYGQLLDILNSAGIRHGVFELQPFG